MKALLYVAISLEALAFITSIIYWYKIKNSKYWWLPIYLLIITLAELFGQVTNAVQNKVLFNTILLLEPAVYIALAILSIEAPILKATSKACLILYVAAAIYNINILTAYHLQFVNISYTVGALLVIITYLIYLASLVFTATVIQFAQQLYFWIGTAVFIFLLITLLKDSIINYWVTLSKNDYSILAVMQYLASNILYLGYIIGFYKCQPINK
jgi:hypothetical protein